MSAEQKRTGGVKPVVSVVVPCYNRAEYLGEALGSAFAQEYAPFEVVVVDDGSTDGSADVARGYPVRYLYQENKGHAGALNAGLAGARGELVALLDADDRWTPDKLRAQVGYMLEHPEVWFTLSQQRFVVMPGAGVSAKVVAQFYTGDKLELPCGSLVARAGAFERVGLFDPSFRVCCDLDWVLRAKDAGLAMAVLPDVLLNRRMHGGNISWNMAVTRSEMLRAYKASADRQRDRHARKGAA